MAVKKNFMPVYEPPRLVRARDRWYISFYCEDDLDGGQRKKFRPTFNLNRIASLKDREARALELVAKLRVWLDAGKPISKFHESKVRVTAEVADEFPLMRTPVSVAIDHIVQLKGSLRHDTARSYKSVARKFVEFLDRKKWGIMEIGDVSKMHARGYLDDCIITRKLSPTSWNNQVSFLRTIFNDLVDRGYMRENPFTGIKKKKELPKARRTFTLEEAQIVLKRVREESELLFYVCIIQYCCHFRPGEIQKMRFRDIDLKRGLISMDYTRTKDWDNRVTTIPAEFLPFFDPEFFNMYPVNSFVFGAGWKPGQSKPCSKQVAFRLHEKILHQLQQDGQLHDILGLVLYSWKDTGITHALENLPLLAVQDQAGHSTGQVTLRYRHKELVNEAYKQGFSNKVIP
jgi:integrase